MITVKKVLSVWYFILYVSVIISVMGSLTLILVTFTEKKVMISNEPHLDDKFTLFFSLDEKICDDSEENAYGCNDTVTVMIEVPVCEDVLRYEVPEVDG